MTSEPAFTHIMNSLQEKWEAKCRAYDTLQAALQSQARMIAAKDSVINHLESQLSDSEHARRNLANEVEKLKAVSCDPVDVVELEARNESLAFSIRILQNENGALRNRIKTLEDKLQAIQNMAGDA